MTLDINSNGSYFYNGNQKKKKDEEDSDSEEENKDDEEKSDKHSYQHKSADASSLEVLGMQNALMIHQESIVHNPHDKRLVESDTEISLHNDGRDSEKSAPSVTHSENLRVGQISSKHKSEAVKNNDELKSDSELLSKADEYEKLGIVRNEDGTFSVRNNPFGKFTKATIEDYISRYILPSFADAWINGYSKLYTVNDKKILLMKVTSKDGKKAFKGRIIENGEKYIIFYGVNDKGLPDGNKVLKKLKINAPTQST